MRTPTKPPLNVLTITIHNLRLLEGASNDTAALVVDNHGVDRHFIKEDGTVLLQWIHVGRRRVQEAQQAGEVVRKNTE